VAASDNTSVIAKKTSKVFLIDMSDSVLDTLKSHYEKFVTLK